MPTSTEFATPAVLAFLAVTSLATVLRVRGPHPRPGGSDGSPEADPRQRDDPDRRREPPDPEGARGAADAAQPQGEPAFDDHGSWSPGDPGPGEDARVGAGGDDRAAGRHRVGGEALVRAWHRAAYARYEDERR